MAEVDHVEFRDDRLVAFLSVGKDKKHIQYVLRAVVPGTWTVPPPDAMAMYDAQAHGRGATDRVEISMP